MPWNWHMMLYRRHQVEFYNLWSTDFWSGAVSRWNVFISPPNGWRSHQPQLCLVFSFPLNINKFLTVPLSSLIHTAYNYDFFVFTSWLFPPYVSGQTSHKSKWSHVGFHQLYWFPQRGTTPSELTGNEMSCSKVTWGGWGLIIYYLTQTFSDESRIYPPIEQLHRSLSYLALQMKPRA